MLVFGVEHIGAFPRKHPQAKKPLEAWLKVIQAEKFSNPIELKRKIPYVDYVKPYTIFDIKGNHVRIIAIVVYGAEALAIKYVLTHDEYIRKKWRTL